MRWSQSLGIESFISYKICNCFFQIRICINHFSGKQYMSAVLCNCRLIAWKLQSIDSYLVVENLKKIHLIFLLTENLMIVDCKCKITWGGAWVGGTKLINKQDIAMIRYFAQQQGVWSEPPLVLTTLTKVSLTELMKQKFACEEFLNVHVLPEKNG